MATIHLGCFFRIHICYSQILVVWFQLLEKFKCNLCVLCAPSQFPVLFENICQWMQIYPPIGRYMIYTSKHACFKPFQECSCKIAPVNLMACQQVLTKVVDSSGNIAYNAIHAQKKKSLSSQYMNEIFCLFQVFQQPQFTTFHNQILVQPPSLHDE